MLLSLFVNCREFQKLPGFASSALHSNPDSNSEAAGFAALKRFLKRCSCRDVMAEADERRVSRAHGECPPSCAWQASNRVAPSLLIYF